MAALSTESPEKVAIPSLVHDEMVPRRWALTGPPTRSSATSTLPSRTVAPALSTTATWMADPSEVPAIPLAGSDRNLSATADGGVTCSGPFTKSERHLLDANASMVLAATASARLPHFGAPTGPVLAPGCTKAPPLPPDSALPTPVKGNRHASFPAPFRTVGRRVILPERCPGSPDGPAPFPALPDGRPRSQPCLLIAPPISDAW